VVLDDLVKDRGLGPTAFVAGCCYVGEALGFGSECAARTSHTGGDEASIEPTRSRPGPREWHPERASNIAAAGGVATRSSESPQPFAGGIRDANRVDAVRTFLPCRGPNGDDANSVSTPVGG
jgi:hypothetical protein